MKKRTHTTLRIGDVLNQSNDLHGIKEIQTLQRILANWSDISGRFGAAIGRPTYFEDGHLVIETDFSGAGTNNHSENAASMREALEPLLRKFGVRDITYTATQYRPRTTHKRIDISSSAAERTSDIQDTDLRNAMAALLTAFDKSKHDS